MENGYVNSRSSRMWSAEYLLVFQKLLLPPKKTFGVWYSVSRRRVVGHPFLEDTVDGHIYRDIIKQFILLLKEDEHDCWFQQDGAMSHT